MRYIPVVFTVEEIELASAIIVHRGLSRQERYARDLSRSEELGISYETLVRLERLSTRLLQGIIQRSTHVSVS